MVEYQCDLRERELTVSAKDSDDERREKMEAYLMPSIMVTCAVLGFAIKQALPWDRAHDFIPLGCAVVGTVLACGFLGWSLDSIATGAVSGIAATGLWEQIIHVLPKGE